MRFYAFSLLCTISAFTVSENDRNTVSQHVQIDGSNNAEMVSEVESIATTVSKHVKTDGRIEGAASHDLAKVRTQKVETARGAKSTAAQHARTQKEGTSAQDKAAPPGSFIAMASMLTIHGFFLDVIIIGILPLVNAVAAEASRQELFPWCLGGYEGFGSEKVPNLAPTHRRFIAENAAYAILRGGAGLSVLYDPATAMPTLVLAVWSHWAEAVTIAWELVKYNAVTGSTKPLTLMVVFSSWTLATVMTNSNDYLTVDKGYLLAMQVLVGLTVASWLVGLGGVGMRSYAEPAKE